MHQLHATSCTPYWTAPYLTLLCVLQSASGGTAHGREQAAHARQQGAQPEVRGLGTCLLLVAWCASLSWELQHNCAPHGACTPQDGAALQRAARGCCRDCHGCAACLGVQVVIAEQLSLGLQNPTHCCQCGAACGLPMAEHAYSPGH